MKCHDCNDQLALYAEGLLDQPAAKAVHDHFSGCADCRTEEQATRQLRNRLLAAGAAPVRASLDQRVMDQILSRQVELTRRLKMRRQVQMFAWSGLAAALLVSLTWAALNYRPARATADEIIARGVRAAAHLKSIYMKCRMRTLPGDNFQMLAPDQGFVDVELWKQYDPTRKWKIQKPGRVVVMNGQETVMLIHNRFGSRFDGPSAAAFDTDWLHQLAAIDKALARELGVGVSPEIVPSDGAAKTPDRVTVEVRTTGLSDGYLNNKLLSASDTRREYTFDRGTGRLEQARFYCRADGKEVLILEIAEIKYDAAFDDSTFELNVPDNVVWHREPQRLPDNEKYEKMTPAAAARTFFEACRKRDWDEADKFFPRTMTDDTKAALGGLEIVTLGEPFQAWPYAGWFVPYELRFNDGQVRKHNLALRNDNPAKRFVVDGGL
jgi:outer membrane lipoprotein-sorting protein